MSQPSVESEHDQALRVVVRRSPSLLHFGVSATIEPDPRHPGWLRLTINDGRKSMSVQVAKGLAAAFARAILAEAED